MEKILVIQVDMEEELLEDLEVTLEVVLQQLDQPHAVAVLE